MTNGLLAFGVVAAIVLCCGCILAFMIMRGAWNRQERESLTSQDLTALEESAVLLVEQLKAEADRGIVEIERRCESLRELIREADDRIARLSDLPEHVRPVRPQPSQDGRQIVEMLESGMDSAEIARSLRLTIGEVDLLLNVQRSTLNAQRSS